MHASLLTQDLLFSSQIRSAAAREGWTTSIVRSPSELEPSTQLVIVDLSSVDSAQLDLSLQHARQISASLLAFAPHVHHDRLEMARSRGCTWVMTRGQLHRECQHLFRRLAEQTAQQKGNDAGSSGRDG